MCIRDRNNKACLHFFWPSLERQIIIKAELEKVAENLSDGYFHSRPKGSQLGAVVTPQSSVIPVSYTHLDVYKRQVQTTENAFQNNAFLYGDAAVSYTHLDVYKRQKIQRIFLQKNFFLTKNQILPIRRKVF